MRRASLPLALALALGLPTLALAESGTPQSQAVLSVQSEWSQIAAANTSMQGSLTHEAEALKSLVAEDQKLTGQVAWWQKCFAAPKCFSWLTQHGVKSGAPAKAAP